MQYLEKWTYTVSCPKDSILVLQAAPGHHHFCFVMANKVQYRGFNAIFLCSGASDSAKACIQESQECNSFYSSFQEVMEMMVNMTRLKFTIETYLTSTV